MTPTMRCASRSPPSGPRCRRCPDGETGERHNWIIHIIEAMRSHPDLEVKKDGDWSDYDKTSRCSGSVEGTRCAATASTSGTSTTSRTAGRPSSDCATNSRTRRWRSRWVFPATSTWRSSRSVPPALSATAPPSGRRRFARSARSIDGAATTSCSRSRSPRSSHSSHACRRRRGRPWRAAIASPRDRTPRASVASLERASAFTCVSAT